jgi:hypothetical protein
MLIGRDVTIRGFHAAHRELWPVKCGVGHRAASVRRVQGRNGEKHRRTCRSRRLPRIPAAVRLQRWRADQQGSHHPIYSSRITPAGVAAGDRDLPPLLISSGQSLFAEGRSSSISGAVVRRVVETGSVRPGREIGRDGMRQPGRGGRCCPRPLVHGSEIAEAHPGLSVCAGPSGKRGAAEGSGRGRPVTHSWRTRSTRTTPGEGQGCEDQLGPARSTRCYSVSKKTSRSVSTSVVVPGSVRSTVSCPPTFW